VNAYILASYGGFWAYTGYDALNSGIEEVDNPRRLFRFINMSISLSRTLPLAVTGGLIVITLFYALINIAYISVLGADGMLASIAVGQV
jgi:amino acid transporter